MKYLINSLLFLTLHASLLAQGICDSIISIGPINPVCQGTGYTLLTSSHGGGQYSGPGTSPYNPYLDAEELNPGFYTVHYTITGPGGCTVSASRDFEVRPALEANAFVSGSIDCSNPNSGVNVIGFIPPDPSGAQYPFFYWEGPELSNQHFYNQSFNTTYAGKYKLTAHSTTSQVCPAFGFAEVPFHNNPLDIHIVSCTNCGTPSGTRITLDTIPTGWYQPFYSLQTGFFDNSNCRELMETGLLKATLTNPNNGCISETSRFFSSLKKTPSVSAGSDVGLWCGGTPSLLAATDPMVNDNGFSFFWERPDGSTYPAFWGSLLPVSEPGNYVLRGVNLFTGCSTSDVAYVWPAPPLFGSEIKILCDGESFQGHTQAGAYTDTLTLPNGCKKIQFTKLIFLAPLESETQVQPDNGQMNGSIQFTVTQGWPPYSYAWSNGETSASISHLSAGTYTVSVTDANGCEHIREVIIPQSKPIDFHQQATGNRSTPNILRTRLFPNPAPAGDVQSTLEIQAAEAGATTLVVTDVLGRIQLIREVELIPGNNKIPVSASLTEGVYSLVLRSHDGNKEVAKLVITGQ